MCVFVKTQSKHVFISSQFIIVDKAAIYCYCGTDYVLAVYTFSVCQFTHSTFSSFISAALKHQFDLDRYVI